MRATLLALVAVLLVTGALRIIGMTWGLPYQLHPDEPVLFIGAWELWDGVQTPSLQGDYPRLYLYLLAAQREFIAQTSGADTPQVVYFFFGRWTAVLISLLLVAVGYRAGREGGGVWGGMALSAWLAVESISVTDQGWIIKADSLAWLLALLTLFYAFRYLRTPAWGPLLLVGLLAPLTVLAKYNLTPILLLPAYLLLYGWLRRPALVLGISLLALMGGGSGLQSGLNANWQGEIEPRFAHCSGFSDEELAPYYDVNRIRRDWPCEPFWAVQRHAYFLYWYSSPWEGPGRETANYLWFLMQNYWGRGLIYAGVLALAFAWWQFPARRPAMGLMVFMLISTAYLFILLGNQHPLRQYMLLILCAGALFALLVGQVAGRSRLLYGLLLLVFLAQPLSKGLHFRRDLLQPDTRALTADFMLGYARQGEAVLVEYDGVEFQNQYGGFPRPEGYFKVRVLQGLHQVPAANLAQEGIYYVVADERSQVYPEVSFWEQAIPEDYALLLDLRGEGYFGPGRQLYRTFRPDYELQAQFGRQIHLEGYDLHLGLDELTLRLYWHSLAEDLGDYSLFLHLYDAGGLVAQFDGPPQRSTPQWERYEWVFDERVLALAGLPPGEYHLKLGWYDPQTGTRLSAPGWPADTAELAPFILDRGGEGGPQDED